MRAASRFALSLALCAPLARAADAVVVASVPGERAVTATTPAAATLDRLRLGDGAELAGRARLEALAVATPLGDLAIASDEVAAIARDGAGVAVVTLSDGGRAQGVLAGVVRFTAGDSVAITLPAGDLAEFAPAAPPAAAPGAGPWLVLGANRLAARWTGTSVRVRGACGAIDVPVERVAAVLAPSPERPLGAIALRDGSRLCGVVGAPPARALRGGDAPDAAWGVEAAAIAPVVDAPRLRLASGDLIAGRIEDLRLATAYGEVAVPAASLRRLRGLPRDERVFACELADGSRIEGRLAGATLRVALPWDAVVVVPCALVRGLE